MNVVHPISPARAPTDGRQRVVDGKLLAAADERLLYRRPRAVGEQVEMRQIVELLAPVRQLRRHGAIGQRRPLPHGEVSALDRKTANGDGPVVEGTPPTAWTALAKTTRATIRPR